MKCDFHASPFLDSLFTLRGVVKDNLVTFEETLTSNVEERRRRRKMKQQEELA